jgi:hypothetical protein
MIFQHYRELVPRKEAEKFWQIMPEVEEQPADAPAKHQAPMARAARKATRSPLSARSQSALPGKSVSCT